MDEIVEDETFETKSTKKRVLKAFGLAATVIIGGAALGAIVSKTFGSDKTEK